jgi:hypothetical protein
LQAGFSFAENRASPPAKSKIIAGALRDILVEGGKKLLSVETSDAVRLFIGQFYGLNPSTIALSAIKPIKPVVSTNEQFVATPLESSFAFKQLFGFLEKEQKDKFIQFMGKQKNKAELINALGKKINSAKYEHLIEPLKNYTAGL